MIGIYIMAGGFVAALICGLLAWRRIEQRRLAEAQTHMLYGVIALVVMIAGLIVSTFEFDSQSPPAQQQVHHVTTQKE